MAFIFLQNFKVTLGPQGAAVPQFGSVTMWQCYNVALRQYEITAILQRYSIFVHNVTVEKVKVLYLPF